MHHCSLFLQDAGIDFDEKRYPYDDNWPATSAKLKQEGLTPTGKLPSIEYKGKVLIQVRPTSITRLGGSRCLQGTRPDRFCNC